MSKLLNIVIDLRDEKYTIIARNKDWEEIKCEDTKEIDEALLKVIGFCEKIKTDGEKLQEQKDKILTHFIKNTTDEEKQKNLNLFDRWKSEGILYKQDSYVVHRGVLYICIKQHYSDYESIPALDAEHWKKAPSGKERNPKLPKEKPDIYNHEKRYSQGEYTIFNSKVYKYVAPEPAEGESPFSAKSKWEEIGEWED